MDLHNAFRPKNFSEVIGQDPAVATCRGWIKTGKIPQCVAFLGSTGTGKTSMARLLAVNVNRDHPKTQTVKYNCADERGLDLIREGIEPQLTYAPMDGSKRVFELDELCQLPKTTQQAMLTLLEEPPAWAYFFCCSTPAKFEKAFIGRFKTITLKPLSANSLYDILIKICDKLKRVNTSTADLLNKIIDISEGSARQAISHLERALAVEDPLSVLDTDPETGAVIDLCRLIFSKKTEPWSKVSSLLRQITEPPETARRIILAYANKCLLSGLPFAGYVIRKFEYSFDQSGDAGLTVAVWDVVHKK